MELIIFLAIVAVGLFWYFNNKNQAAPVANEADSAPYKVETPPEAPVTAPTVTEIAAAAEPVAARPKKTSAAKAKKPAAIKAKAPAKKPRAKKTAA